METKIPPPIVTLVFALSIYLSRGIFKIVEIKHSFYLGIFLLLLGFAILISAVRLFKKDNTTINPLSPEQATKLVTYGIFKYSRNPMYLGMAFVLGSIAAFFFLLSFDLFVEAFVFEWLSWNGTNKNDWFFALWWGFVVVWALYGFFRFYSIWTKPDQDL